MRLQQVSPAGGLKPIEPSPSWHPSYGDRLAPAVGAFDLKRMLHILRRHLWVLVLTTLAAAGVAAYFTYTEQPVYRANAVVRLTDVRRELTGKLSDDDGGAGPGRANADPVLSLIQILTSRAVAGEVVDGREAAFFRLRTEGIPQSLLRNTAVEPSARAQRVRLQFGKTHVVVGSGRQQQRVTYGTPVSVDGVRFAVVRQPKAGSGAVVVQSREKAVDRLLAKLQGRPREHTDIIDVQYSADDPAVAQRVVNAVVTILKDYSTRSARDQSLRRRTFIEDQLRQNDSALASAQQALGAFRNRGQGYSSPEQLVVTQEGLAALAGKREELDTDRRMYASLLSSVRGGGGRLTDERLGTLVAAPGVTNNPVVMQLFTQLVRFQSARDSLTTGPWASAPTHPDVIRLDTLIAATRGRLVGAAQSYIGSLDARIAALDAIARARTNLALQQQQPAAAAQEGLLQQRAETLRKLSDQLREEYQKARLAEAVQAGDVEIVDLAPLPGATVGVGRSRKLTAGILVGLMLGAGIAYVIEHLNTSIRRRSDMESLLQIPGLAVIPQMYAKPAMGVRAARQFRLGGVRDNTMPTPAMNGLITASTLGSSSAEAYRTLRTNLLFSQTVQRLKTIVITSTAPGDGKTTVATNLAVTFGQQGRRVLLIDCDLRRARVHEVFGVPLAPGLSEAMMDRGSVADAIVPAPEAEGLFLLPAGRLPRNPAELLGGPSMRQLLESLENDFDLVLLDSPPVLAASDAAILGTIADGVLMVVRAGQTDRDEARDALRQLGTVGARVIGAVLNDPDARVPQYAEFYYEYATNAEEPVDAPRAAQPA